jgi:hypothetical protein
MKRTVSLGEPYFRALLLDKIEYSSASRSIYSYIWGRAGRALKTKRYGSIKSRMMRELNGKV